MKIEKLLEKVKAGDTDALKIIYERYSPMMRSICFSITKEDEDTINDLVQDAFVLTYYSLSKLKDNSKFKEWHAEASVGFPVRGCPLRPKTACRLRLHGNILSWHCPHR